jgi:hypothetical protein
VNIRVEHVKHSKCRQEFLDRVQANHAAHVKAKETGGASCSLSVQSVYMLICASDRARLAPPRAGSSARVTYRLYCRQRPGDDRPGPVRDHHLKGAINRAFREYCTVQPMFSYVFRYAACNHTGRRRAASV